MKKIKAGILGATGTVGQMYIHLLANHPWFDITYLAASPDSAGKTYKDAVGARWQIDSPIPDAIMNLKVGDANLVSQAKGSCDFVFSALEMEKHALQALEMEYAKQDIPVISNASAHRFTDDIPMLIPEINHSHTDIIPYQKKNRGWNKGFIAVKPNCSLQSYLTPLFALIQQGYEVKRIVLTTLQAISGAGYPGVPSLDMIDNIIPYIRGEEEKSELEPLKILGHIQSNAFVDYKGLKIAAHCNRVSVVDGHTACVSLEFGEKKPGLEEIKKIWKDFRSYPQEMALPFAPEHPILYREEENRPQPKKDRNQDKGMAVTVGRLRPCPVFDIRFVGLSHNTIRGAAGGGILNAEVLYKKGFLE
ncbi:MAG: aspartate-semialdehyde dehydrogenase [Candidatus Brocadiae bacterium]|nr:aspartate-semialdehyde dehydrogenase [Candidatus Brocadiia bacterium]